MSAMVERVARAMFPQWWEMDYKSAVLRASVQDGRNRALAFARAAIAAMQTMTPDMIAAAQQQPGRCEAYTAAVLTALHGEVIDRDDPRWPR